MDEAIPNDIMQKSLLERAGLAGKKMVHRPTKDDERRAVQSPEQSAATATKEHRSLKPVPCSEAVHRCITWIFLTAAPGRPAETSAA